MSAVHPERTLGWTEPRTPTPRVSVSYERRPETLYHSIIGLAKVVFAVKRWRVTVSGEEHIPTSGPAIIAANHIGLTDFLFLGFAADRRHRVVRFMAIRNPFDHRLLGPFVRRMRHIPVDRDGDPTASYDHAVQALTAGEIVGLHPEAHVNRSKAPGSVAIRAAKTGAARMALATGAPLIPAAVWGSQHLLAPGATSRFPRDLTITVSLGPAMAFDMDTNPHVLTTRLMERIQGLCLDASASDRLTNLGP
jgi:1-acyl-sn-glycerol-3-phosphate acyltransferase